MQTVLGATGQIGEELTRALYQNHTKDIRLVSRNPKKIHASDQLFPANLTDAAATEKAVEGSTIAYLTVGLPLNAQLWEAQFPVIMQNVIAACKKQGCKLVFFDNTYMYAKTAAPQTEESPFAPIGRKSIVRARMAEMLLDEISKQSIEAVICRAPEFYGPDKTQSFTNTLVFDRIRQGEKPRVPLKDDTKRTLIWTPDASWAMALIGNTPEAYQQTWHLPCDDSRPTYKELIQLISRIYGREMPYSILKNWQFKIGSWSKPLLKEMLELLPRYTCDNIFVSDKFKEKFPDFKVTTFGEGIRQIKNEQPKND